MDIRRSGIDGLEALRQIRANDAIRTIPIVTSRHLPWDRAVGAVAAGFEAYHAKPLNVKAFMATVGERCSRDEAVRSGAVEFLGIGSKRRLLMMDRRAFLRIGGLVALAASGRSPTTTAQTGVTSPPVERSDYTLRIGTGLVELAPDRILSTTTYNSQFPGPLLRFKEGQRVVIDVHNDTDTPEQLHWHGQVVPVDVDGAAEEGTPYIPAHGMRRIAFTPRPAAFRFYPTHL